MKKTSEFGKGFIYNLVLFSKHVGKIQSQLGIYRNMNKKNPTLFSDEDALEMWFNGSSDHFYELTIPKQWKNTEIGKLANWIVDQSLNFGHGFNRKPTIEETMEVVDAVEKLALLIDKELEVKTIEATYN